MHLRVELAFFGHAREQGLQLDQPARLGEIVKRALPERGDRGVERRLAGKHHGFGSRRQLLGLGDHFDAAKAGHVEIDQNAVVGVAFERGDGGRAIGTDRDLMAHARQFEAHQLLQRAFVVGEE